MRESSAPPAGESAEQHTQGLHFKAPGGPGPAQRDSLAFDGSYWSSVVPESAAARSAMAQQQPKLVAAAVDPISPKELGSMMLYKTKLQAVIWELRGAMQGFPHLPATQRRLLAGGCRPAL